MNRPVIKDAFFKIEVIFYHKAEIQADVNRKCWIYIYGITCIRQLLFILSPQLRVA